MLKILTIPKNRNRNGIPETKKSSLPYRDEYLQCKKFAAKTDSMCPGNCSFAKDVRVCQILQPGCFVRWLLPLQYLGA